MQNKLKNNNREDGPCYREQALKLHLKPSTHSDKHSFNESYHDDSCGDWNDGKQSQFSGRDVYDRQSLPKL